MTDPAYPRGTYLSQDPAGWTYGGGAPGMRTELDARIKAYLAAHPDVTTRADAEHAIRTADRRRAEKFLAGVKRGQLGALIGGGRDNHEPQLALGDVDLAIADRRCGCGHLIFGDAVTCNDCYDAVRYDKPRKPGQEGTA
jgi:hypothetical protein